MTPSEQLLQDRARALARPLASDHGAERLLLMGIRIGDRAYALEAAYVREVLATAQVSHLPWAPPGVVGVTNVRGEILTVTDLGRLLGLAATRSDGPVVIVDAERTLGLRVDEVQDISALRPEDLGAPEGEAASAAGNLVLGYTTSAVVLDVRALSAAPRRTTPSQETS